MKNAKLIRLITILAGAGLLLVAFFLFAADFIGEKAEGLGITVNVHYTGYQLAFGSDYNDLVGGILVNWIFQLLLLLGACFIVVFDLFGALKLKFLDNKIIRFCIAGGVLVLALVCGILSFASLGLANSTLLLAPGAVFNGIFAILGGASLACGVVLPALSK
ncbi:MAG: hypothetical protein K6E59_01105 [Bacilli bacterium]|nr:hypothetical protein [Bacilli bacterium]